MIRSDLIRVLEQQFMNISCQHIDAMVKGLFEQMVQTVAKGNRVEIRGFGTFSTKVLKPRDVRNPKTGEVFKIGDRITLHFKPGKQLKDEVNRTASSGE